MKPALPDFLTLSLALFLSLFLPACGRGPSEQSAPGNDGPRIVSLIPAATLTLVDLTLEDHVVGVGEHDPAAEALLPRETPRVGSFLDVDDERLAALRPTVVIAPEGAAFRVPEGAELLTQPYPVTVADAAWNISELGRLGAPALAADSAGNLRTAYQRDPPDPDGPRTLLAFGTSPVWASGPGTVNDDALRAAGGVNALADAAVPALTLDDEALLALKPELVLLLLPGREPAAAEAERAALGARLPEARVVVLTDPFILLPGPNLGETIRLFRRAVRGETGGDPGPRWVPGA